MMLAAQSDTLPLITVDDYADNFLAQQISQVRGVAQVHHRRRAASGDPHPGRPGQARLERADAGGRAQRPSSAQPRLPRRARVNTAQDELHHRGQRSDHRSGAVRRHRPRLPQRRPDQGSRCRPGGRRPRPTAPWRLTQNGKHGILLVVFKQPGANVIDTVDQIKAQLPRLINEHSAVHQRLDPARPHHHDPRLGGGRRVHPGC